MATSRLLTKESLLWLPPGLVQAVQNKRVVMFLGVGASMEARGPNNTKPPSADMLRSTLANHFFGRPMDGYDLMSVADMAITTAGQAVMEVGGIERYGVNGAAAPCKGGKPGGSRLTAWLALYKIFKKPLDFLSS